VHPTDENYVTDQYSALGPVLAGTRAQSGDRYGSGTLHSEKFLRGSLPLLSPENYVLSFKDENSFD
jgi:hypothetical protein